MGARDVAEPLLDEVPDVPEVRRAGTVQELEAALAVARGLGVGASVVVDDTDDHRPREARAVPAGGAPR